MADLWNLLAWLRVGCNVEEPGTDLVLARELLPMVARHRAPTPYMPDWPAAGEARESRLRTAPYVGGVR